MSTDVPVTKNMWLAPLLWENSSIKHDANPDNPTGLFRLKARFKISTIHISPENAEDVPEAKVVVLLLG